MTSCSGVLGVGITTTMITRKGVRLAASKTCPVAFSVMGPFLL